MKKSKRKKPCEFCKRHVGCPKELKPALEVRRRDPSSEKAKYETLVLVEPRPSRHTTPLPFLSHQCPQCESSIYAVKERWLITKEDGFSTCRYIKKFHSINFLDEEE